MKEADKQERQQARRAECFSRLMLRKRKYEDGRSLLDHAERTAGRLAMQWEKEIAWLAAALEADGVDETTLTGLGFDENEVRHATIAQPRNGETATNYAERIAAYNQPEAFEVAAAMLADPSSKNPAIPKSTTEEERLQAIEQLQQGMLDWHEYQKSKHPPAGGFADDRPTARGLREALDRLEHHTRMSERSLNEMVEGPGNSKWGIVERLDQDDMRRFMLIGMNTVLTAAGIVMDLSILAKEPATTQERENINVAVRLDTNAPKAIAIIAATIGQVANRLSQGEPWEDPIVH